jgi:hypothetical protein
MWYEFSFNPDITIMGSDTQIKKIYDEALNFKHDISSIFYDEHLDKNYYLNYIELKSSAKITDVIWEYEFKQNGLFVSRKVYNILKDFKMYNPKIYSVKVKKGAKQYEYFYIRLAGDLTPYIDFKKSTFRWYQAKTGIKEEINFQNLDEYLSKKNIIGPIDSIKPIRIYFNDEFLKFKYDMIFLGKFNTLSIWINEKLKKRLEEEEVTGFEFDKNQYLMNGSE